MSSYIPNCSYFVHDEVRASFLIIQIYNLEFSAKAKAVLNTFIRIIGNIVTTIEYLYESQVCYPIVYVSIYYVIC
jgi:hypothetical protein